MSDIVITILFYIYIVIGIIICCLDWRFNQSYKYEAAKKKGKVEDGMVVLYMMGVIIFWPIKICRILNRSWKRAEKNTGKNME